MNRLTLFVSTLVFFAVTALTHAAPAWSPSVLEYVKPWSTDPMLVSAVKKQNTEGLSLEVIKQRDKVWMATPGIDEFMGAILNNRTAAHLKELESSKPYFLELFLMDNQGALVAMTNKTSDYWQGDERKWQKSFNGGQGGVDIGKEKFDKSAQAYLVQVSIPIMDGDKAVGALTIGVNLDKLAKK
jgi:hypothetical protein